jgi:hypothetical protein
MFLELERCEHAALVELVRREVGALEHALLEATGRPPPDECGQETLRCRVEVLQRALHKLREAEWEATC